MAIAIKTSPELTGESARIFIEEAEKLGQLPTPVLNAAEKSRLEEFLKRSREFVFPPKKTKE